ncbi:hypothetical protein Dda_7732 [Drechslerella dactyloides]|uniref:Uncharacterized protein n=1 Tax=Drechslerella dactyloides TaxID=74499 RepID=A0AAD6IT63_DREDA|nr:hypothetical protein Dda_7732 [Drechslerella dactyloides]
MRTKSSTQSQPELIHTYPLFGKNAAQESGAGLEDFGEAYGDDLAGVGAWEGDGGGDTILLSSM